MATLGYGGLTPAADHLASVGLWKHAGLPAATEYSEFPGNSGRRSSCPVLSCQAAANRSFNDAFTDIDISMLGQCRIDIHRHCHFRHPTTTLIIFWGKGKAKKRSSVFLRH